MLKTLGMFKQIFPGLHTLTSKYNTNDYKLQIAYILQNNGADKVKSKLNSLKYTNQETNDIWFLISILSGAQVVKNLPSFKNLQKNVKLTTKQIRQWATMNGNKNVMDIWNWKLSVSPKDAIAQGMKGKQIGDYIRNKEEELFISS
tara:strand:- start:348 stop:785 length:438 start_codon:yes stop_codon:yes gene_type:complete